MQEAGCRISDGFQSLPDKVVVAVRRPVRFLKGLSVSRLLFALPADRSKHLQSSMSVADLKIMPGLPAAIIPVLAFGRSNRPRACVGTYKQHLSGRRGDELS